MTTYYFGGGSYEVQTDGTTITTKKYYAFGGQTIAMAAPDPENPGTVTLSYFLTDHLGSVVAITDADGVLLEQQRYLPFGQVRTLSGYETIGLTDYGFTGQRNLDAQGAQYTLGLMDYRARFYSSLTGRFIQPDTITPGGPQGLNRFSYTSNNPVNGTDPTGHVTCMDDDDEECLEGGGIPIGGDDNNSGGESDDKQPTTIDVGDTNFGYTYDPQSGLLIIYQGGASRNFVLDWVTSTTDRKNLDLFMTQVNNYYENKYDAGVHTVLALLGVFATGAGVATMVGIPAAVITGAVTIFEAVQARDAWEAMNDNYDYGTLLWNSIESGTPGEIILGG